MNLNFNMVASSKLAASPAVPSGDDRFLIRDVKNLMYACIIEKISPKKVRLLSSHSSVLLRSFEFLMQLKYDMMLSSLWMDVVSL